MITVGQNADAGDFVSAASGPPDSGKVAKLSAAGKIAVGFSPFGGNGANGALTIALGNTTIDLAGERHVVLNYTSISITGTGALAFSNPHANGTTVVLKSQGNVTLTSSAAPMVDCSGQGSAGGVAVSGTNTNTGGTSSAGISFGLFDVVAAIGGAQTTTVGGSLPTAFTLINAKFNSTLVAWKYNRMFLGSGGGGGGLAGGGINTATTGAGGRGGGALVIECGGAWNFTTANGISVAGKNGADATASNLNNCKSCGGAGGGGGFFLAIYNSLTANSGTVTVTGGVKGTDLHGGSGNTASTGCGGNSAVAVGTAGVAVGGTAQSTGGAGAAGISLVAANTEFFS